MKSKRKLIIILCIILMLVIGMRIFIHFKNSRWFDKNNNINNTEVPNQNDNPKNYEEHCLDGLCTKINEFSYIDGYGGFSIIISNKTEQSIEEGFRNIIFSTPTGEFKTFIYHKELLPDESIETFVTFTNKDFMYATNYELMEPTEEELAEYYKNM